MEDTFDKIMEWFNEIMEWIKNIRSIIFVRRKGNTRNKTPKKADNAQEKRKEETVIDLNFKDGRLQYTRKVEYEGARQSQNNRERYGKNEADRTRQTNKGDVKMQKWMRQEMRINRGLNYFDNGEHERAIEYFSQLITETPDDEELYFWRARAYREAALIVKRQNDHNDTEKSSSYFQKSEEDYQKAQELESQ